MQQELCFSSIMFWRSTRKIDFNHDNGSYPRASLLLNNGKFYGMTPGMIFEWDPVTNVYLRKKDFRGSNGSSPGVGNNLAAAPAPVATGSSVSCVINPAINTDSSNNNQWLSITDTLGNAVAEIKANGNNPGIVSTTLFINNAAVRKDVSGKLYLDRNITITAEVQPLTPVDIRLYIKSSEFLALKNTVNSNGHAPGIDSIRDLVIYKIGGNCATTVSSLSNAIITTSDEWEETFVLSASITSFSSFYFTGKQQADCPGPVIACSEDTTVTAKAGRCSTVISYDPVVLIKNGDYFDQRFDCRISPNPSSQYFNLEFISPSNEMIEATLMDISGRLIKRLTTAKNKKDPVRT